MRRNRNYSSEAFTEFCSHYTAHDFDGAAKILFELIKTTMNGRVVMNPLIKPDLSYALAVLSQQDIPEPSSDLFEQTINEVVKYVLQSQETDPRAILN